MTNPVVAALPGSAELVDVPQRGPAAAAVWLVVGLMTAPVVALPPPLPF
jgi:hypothetical protein